jgi:large subunit ribosomal protein L9
MSSKTVELLLVENVENLGIVGDVVSVKAGYARNFLLPRQLATAPSQELMDQLAERRKQAQEEMARLRAAREQMISALDAHQLKIEKACNDQGLLYGSVTQQDIADMLGDLGHAVRPRDVRLGQVIKRIGDYDLTVKPEQDLEATIHLTVEPEGGIIIDDEEAGLDTDEALAAEAESLEETIPDEPHPQEAGSSDAADTADADKAGA